MKKIAVLGAGAHSQLHGRALRLLCGKYPERMSLNAVCDLDLERARRYAGDYGFAKVYADVENMLDRERPDGLIAVTPLDLTTRIVGELLPLKIPLMIEKPPGNSASEAAQLLAIQQMHGTQHMISFNRRFIPPLVRFRTWMRENPQQRTPHTLSARMLRHNRTEPDFVVGTGIHLIDTALSLLGAPQKVRAVRARREGENSSLHHMQIQFRSGAAASLLFAPCAGVKEETYEIIGRDFRAFIDVFKGALEVDAGGKKPGARMVAPGPEPAELDGTVYEMEAFLRMLEGRPDPDMPKLEDGLMALKAAESALHDIARAENECNA